jgi:alpha-1,2-mannosyltransferase
LATTLTADRPPATQRGPLVLLREAHWLTGRRVSAWACVLLTEEMLLLLFLELWQHGVLSASSVRSSSDFVSFYAAGKLALAGTPAQAYVQASHFVAEQRVLGAGIQYQFFFYPPVFLPLCAALAVLPYPLAYALFQLATLAAFLFMMRALLDQPLAGWIAPVLAFPAVIWTIGTGQNAFLTAALLGGFTLLLDRRPVGAGVLLGLLCYKPHFALLAPFACAAGRRWRAFLTATATAIIMVAGSAVLFGWRTWQAYLAALAHSGAVYASGRIDLAGMVTLFGAARLIGFTATESLVAQCAAALCMAALIMAVWSRHPRGPLSAATLLAATLLAIPLALLYDELIVLIAAAWLIRQAGRGNFLPWEKILLFAAYPLSLLTWPVAARFHIPLAPVINLTVLALCLRRLRHGPALPARAESPRPATRTAPAASPVPAGSSAAD